MNSGTHIPMYIGGGGAAEDRRKVPCHPFVEQEQVTRKTSQGHKSERPDSTEKG